MSPPPVPPTLQALGPPSTYSRPDVRDLSETHSKLKEIPSSFLLGHLGL